MVSREVREVREFREVREVRECRELIGFIEGLGLFASELKSSPFEGHRALARLHLEVHGSQK